MEMQDIRSKLVAKYGSETAADEFIKAAADELEKVAKDPKEPAPPLPFQDQVRLKATDGFANGLGNGVAGLGMGIISGVLGGFRKQVGNAIDRTKFLTALERAIQISKVLQTADKTRLMSYAETIHKFAPITSTDPNVLASILSSAIHGEGIDAITIKTLIEMENKLVQTRAGFGR